MTLERFRSTQEPRPRHSSRIKKLSNVWKMEQMTCSRVPRPILSPISFIALRARRQKHVSYRSTESRSNEPLYQRNSRLIPPVFTIFPVYKNGMGEWVEGNGWRNKERRGRRVENSEKRGKNTPPSGINTGTLSEFPNSLPRELGSKR